ncbi:MAG TPA: ABC transporter permease [Solirubrobacteraceae bacterium]|jgi:rhamnose transport system permease protein|nr:ABC transporter permease [Solirubrobacteraceae bacterium]
MSATAPTAPTLAPASPRRLVDFVLRARTFGIIAVLALVVLITSIIEPRFIGGSNIRFILSNTTLYALVAIGETLVVLTRNVDLSVGSVVGLSAYVSANQFQSHHGFPIVGVFLVGLGVGVACGVVTGAITAVGRVPSLVVTLAMLYIIRGVDTIIVGSKQVVANSLPSGFINIFHDTFLGIPDLAWATAIAVAIAAYYLRSYRSGRDLYAIGSDPAAARLAGIPIAKRVFAAFVLSGAIAGLGGVVWAMQYNTVDVNAGQGLELQVIAAVVVGGVAIFGGSGSVVGAALGALLLQTISSALNVLGVPSLWTEAIAGFLLLVAITIDRGIQLRLAVALRRRKVHLGA